MNWVWVLGLILVLSFDFYQRPILGFNLVFDFEISFSFVSGFGSGSFSFFFF
jgi:hypothetical protein